MLRDINNAVSITHSVIKFNDKVCHDARQRTELFTYAKLVMKKQDKKEKNAFFS